MILGFSAVLTATSVFLSLSRGGIASLVMSLVFLGFLLNRRSGQSRRGLLFASTIIVVLYAVGWFGWGPIFDRFQHIRNDQGGISDLRLDIWKDSWNIIRDFPLTGTGFGTYINIYPSYRTIAGEGIADHAHNDYIELFTNGGAVSVLLLLWFAAVVIIRSYHAFQRRRDPYSLFLYSGSLAGIFSILLHSITDFNLQIGANGLFMFVLLGMAVSASHTKIHEENYGTLLREQNSFRGKRLVFAVSLTVLVLCIAFYGGRLAGAFLHSEVRKVPLDSKTTGENLVSVSDTLGRASFFDPLEPEYHYRRALVKSLSSDPPGALREYKAAVRLDPANSAYLQSLGLFLGDQGGENYAEALLRSGMTHDRTNPAAHSLYAVWLAKQGRKSESIDIFKKTITMEPAKTRDHITEMVLSGFTDGEIRSALPERSDSYIVFANYLEQTGNEKMASDIYTTALSYAESAKERSAGSFHAVYNFYMRKQLFASAASVMEKAAGLFPRDAVVRLRLAQSYEKEDLKDKALQQYRVVLEIDPKNTQAQKKVRELQ
jgi:tetratricopeptide (TPR) repeat protein